MTSWVDHAKMPPMYMQTAFSRYLDLNTPPTQAFLKQLQILSSDEKEQKMLGDLSTVSRLRTEHYVPISNKSSGLWHLKNK